MTAAARSALDALCRRIVPCAYTADGGAVDVAATIEQRLAAGDPALRRQIYLLLRLFDSRLLTCLCALRFARFTTLAPAEQDALLAAWERSPLLPGRTIFQALRQLILSTYYAQPEAQRSIGYRPPLHTRRPAVPWEGPLAGSASDAGPVARVPNPRDWTPSSPLPALPASSSPPPPPRPGSVSLGRAATTDLSLTADVCVVGTGAGGTVAAARLAEAGFDVVLLEEGGYWTAADFDESEASMVPKLYAEAGMRATVDRGVSILQGRCVGGGTTVNWMITLRTPDCVLDEWADEHRTEGMRPADMAPIFTRLEDEIHARVVPDDAHAPANRIILDGAAALGWRAQAAAINARDCVRAGTCGLGCRYGAKQSALVTFIPRALAAGARLVSDARVERVEIVERRARGAGRAATPPKKRVHGMLLDGDHGRPYRAITVAAPIVVLAAGAVGTPVILQRSRLGGGGVGRFLRLHPTSAVTGWFDHELYSAAGIPQSAVCDHFLSGNGTGYGFWIECPAVAPALAAAATPGFGAPHRAVVSRFPSLGILIVLLRDGAERDRSYGDVRADRRGRPRIRYRLPDTERRHLVAGLAAAAQLHFAAGAQEILTLHSPQRRLRSPDELDRVRAGPHGPHQLALYSAHVNGTCRIGRDPRTSGAAPEGQRHGVAGLYVADGSLLPTAPGVNPQLTIMAVATVVAQRIADRNR